MFKVKSFLLSLRVPRNDDVEALVLHYFGKRGVLVEIPVPYDILSVDYQCASGLLTASGWNQGRLRRLVLRSLWSF